jgi:Asp-tRNA(Asn)/Glu-tRNA(Gln) amidotransferase B subunit
MINAKIYFELIDNEINSIIQIPEDLTAEEQMIFADRFSNLIGMIQSGNLFPSIFQSVVEAGILTEQKALSELIIRKILESFSVDSEKIPLVSPSEAFLFRETK